MEINVGDGCLMEHSTKFMREGYLIKSHKIKITSKIKLDVLQRASPFSRVHINSGVLYYFIVSFILLTFYTYYYFYNFLAVYG